MHSSNCMLVRLCKCIVWHKRIVQLCTFYWSHHYNTIEGCRSVSAESETRCILRGQGFCLLGVLLLQKTIGTIIYHRWKTHKLMYCMCMCTYESQLLIVQAQIRLLVELGFRYIFFFKDSCTFLSKNALDMITGFINFTIFLGIRVSNPSSLPYSCDAQLHTSFPSLHLRSVSLYPLPRNNLCMKPWINIEGDLHICICTLVVSTVLEYILKYILFEQTCVTCHCTHFVFYT